jgi:hypothetical protein
MGKRGGTVMVKDAPDQKPYRVAATPGEPETAFPVVENDVPQPEVYGFGAAAVQAEAEAADPDGEPPARPDGLATITAALAAEREMGVVSRETGVGSQESEVGSRESEGGEAAVDAGDEVSDGGGASSALSEGAESAPAADGMVALDVADREALVAHLRAVHLDAIPELISGATVAEIVGSVVTAKAAHARVASQVAAAAPVAAGGGARGGIRQDLARLPPLAKISAGLAAHRES